MKNSKRQKLPHGLWIIATPIGNLGDISPRICQALEETEILLAEDTRRTRELLNALGLELHPRLQLKRWDAYSSQKEGENWAKKLQSGVSLALVTDAGTPGLCDPGAQLVRICRELGLRIVPFPGPSALSTLLSVAGQTGANPSFVFRGFFPRVKRARLAEIQLMKEFPDSGLWVWFESPHRLLETAQSFLELLPQAQVILAKELTKIHEKIFSGSWKEMVPALEAEFVGQARPLGEWSFAVYSFAGDDSGSQLDQSSSRRGRLRPLGPGSFRQKDPRSIEDFVETLTLGIEEGASSAFLAKKISQAFPASRPSIYRLLTALRSKR